MLAGAYHEAAIGAVSLRARQRRRRQANGRRPGVRAVAAEHDAGPERVQSTTQRGGELARSRSVRGREACEPVDGGGKADGTGITGEDPARLVTRLLTAPQGLVAALAVDAPEPWSITLT